MGCLVYYKIKNRQQYHLLMSCSILINPLRIAETYYHYIIIDSSQKQYT
jgi:hypothetical protein